MERLTVNSVGKARRTTFGGREFYVVNMVLVVPGVLHGSQGAYLYPPIELQRDPSIWNGMPLVVDHPSRNGESISARDPEVLEKSGIGYAFGAKYVFPEGKGIEAGKLVAEGWFDVALTKKVDLSVYESLRSGRTIELSTGLFADAVKAPLNSVDTRGRPYEYIARNYRADHIAVLPRAKGACSREDGCGVMVNRRQLQTNCAKTSECAACSNWDLNGIPFIEFPDE